MKLKIKKISYKTINPKRDWYFIIIVFFAVSILGVIIGAYMYYVSANYVAEITPVDTTAQDDAGISRLHKAASDIEKKQSDFEKATITTYQVSDPSL